jgi:internalin A
MDNEKTIEEAVREELGKPSGDLTDHDLRKLKNLNLESLGIENIESLSCYTSLEYLNLDDNWITNLSPLSKLINLESLSLMRSLAGQTDLSPLAHLANLEDLTIGAFTGRDLSHLYGLKKLKTVYLEDNCMIPLSDPSNYSNAEIGRLRAALPDCNVTHSNG